MSQKELRLLYLLEVESSYEKKYVSAGLLPTLVEQLNPDPLASFFPFCFCTILHKLSQKGFNRRTET
jgi:hypothetical protein